jgi:hypothetical protein
LQRRGNKLQYVPCFGGESGGKIVDNYTHILKLSVGTESVEDLAAWQASARAQ